MVNTLKSKTVRKYWKFWRNYNYWKGEMPDYLGYEEDGVKVITWRNDKAYLSFPIGSKSLEALHGDRFIYISSDEYKVLIL